MLIRAPNHFAMPSWSNLPRGLEEAGHTSEVVDLYSIRFDPVFRTRILPAMYTRECRLRFWNR